MVTVKSQPSGNTQVSEKAKDIIYSYIEWYGVSNARDLLLHWYNDGEYVCVSYDGEFEGETLSRYIEFISDVLRENKKNRNVEDNFGTIWIHKSWIESNS